MKTILVPIDFSPVTHLVMREAARLARFAKARVVLLNAVQPPIVATDYGLMADNIGFYLNAMEKDADRRLGRLQARLRDAGLRVETVRLTGLSVTGIIAEAKKRSADYIVIGSHGHTAFYDLLVGSTTGGVLKRALCPVVVVPAPKGKTRQAKR
ncbi:MAG TPA: universal stress protein [Opitutaceae bacterium]|nr:universal stress protein [Opitutaceae bacterium]